MIMNITYMITTVVITHIVSSIFIIFSMIAIVASITASRIHHPGVLPPRMNHYPFCDYLSLLPFALFATLSRSKATIFADLAAFATFATFPPALAASLAIM